MSDHTRRFHAKEIFRTWWALVYGGLWGLLCSADVIVSHIAPASFRVKWDAAWIAPKWGWPVTLAGFALITILLIFEKSFRMVREAKDATDEKIALVQTNCEDLRRQLESALASKPIITSRFEGGPHAVLSITNKGAIAWMWASLRVNGMISGCGPFARWGDSGSYKIKLAKGETRYIKLASLEISDRISTWMVHSATESAVHNTKAIHSSLIGITNDGQAEDIDLYVKVFSDPDCLELQAERHIVLHSHRAELGD